VPDKSDVTDVDSSSATSHFHKGSKGLKNSSVLELIRRLEKRKARFKGYRLFPNERILLKFVSKTKRNGKVREYWSFDPAGERRRKLAAENAAKVQRFPRTIRYPRLPDKPKIQRFPRLPEEKKDSKKN